MMLMPGGRSAWLRQTLIRASRQAEVDAMHLRAGAVPASVFANPGQL